MEVCAADIGGTTIKLALVRDGRIATRLGIPADAARGLACALERIAGAWADLCGQAGISFASVQGCGLAVPGVVAVGGGRIWATPGGKFDDAPRLDLHQWAAEHLGKPLTVDNDARAALVGEHQYGAARGCRDVCMMTLGTGVGTAVLLGGRPLYGAHGLAGNALGHVTIDIHGTRCACGNVGCVETLASAAALRQRLTETADAPSPRGPGGPTDYEALFRRADEGDAQAAAIGAESLHAWGTVAATLVNAYDPEKLIIGGGIAARADLVLPAISECIKTGSWARWPIPVVAAELGADAGTLGIAHLAANACGRS